MHTIKPFTRGGYTICVWNFYCRLHGFNCYAQTAIVCLVSLDFWFLQFQPELLTSNIINWQRLDYSAIVFFRAHHTTL